MKTEGRRPSPRLSACKSTVVRQTKIRKVQQPHCEMEDDVCRVVFAASRDAFLYGKPNEFPFFHARARQLKVSLLTTVRGEA